MDWAAILLDDRLHKDEDEPPPSSTLLDSQYSQHFNSNLVHMWQERVMCDVTLKVAGRAFPCHKLVLCAGSRYFRAMFTENFAEKTQSIIELREMDSQAFEIVLKYIYTGDLKLDDSTTAVENLHAVVHILSLLGLETALASCWEYFKKILNKANCCYFLSVADLHGAKELADQARQYLKGHFETMQVECLLNCPYSDLIECIKGASLRSERSLLQIVIHWVKFDSQNRSNDIVKLLASLRLGLLPKEDLQEACSILSPYNPIENTAKFEPFSEFAQACIRGDPSIAWPSSLHLDNMCKVRSEAFRPVVFASQKIRLESAMGKPRSDPRQPWEDDFDVCNMYVEKVKRDYRFEDEDEDYSVMWPKVMPWLIAGTSHPLIKEAATCHLNNFLFVCGGINKHNAISNRCFMFNPRFLNWTEFATLVCPRAKFALVEVKGHLYAIGGISSEHHGKDYWRELVPNSYSHPSYHLSSVEQYTYQTDTWVLYDFLPFPMRRPFAIQNNGFVFLFFGEHNAPSEAGALPHAFFRYDVNQSKELTRIHDVKMDAWMDEGALCSCHGKRWGKTLLFVDTASGTEVYLPMKKLKRNQPAIRKAMEYPINEYKLPLPLGALCVEHRGRVYFLNGSVGGPEDFRTSTYVMSYKGAQMQGFSIQLDFKKDLDHPQKLASMACLEEGMELETYYGGVVAVPMQM